MEREAVGRAAPDAGQTGELGDEVLDGGRKHPPSG
jgi:hypothetical protein